MNNSHFEHALTKLIGRPSDLRPFVCNGSPLNCTVFIVGFNATTEMNFWSFWEGNAGYNKLRWEEAYRQERRAIGKNELSNTRAMLGWIIDNLPGINVLETNVYAKASPRATDLGKYERDTSAFRFLLNAIQPKVILTHGEKAIEAIKPFLDEHGHTVTLLTTKHLRYWSRARAIDLANRIQQALA